MGNFFVEYSFYLLIIIIKIYITDFIKIFNNGNGLAIAIHFIQKIRRVFGLKKSNKRVAHICEITVETAEPTIPYRGINKKFSPIFVRPPNIVL